MSLAELARGIESRLGEALLAREERSARRLWVTVRPEHIREVVGYLSQEVGGRLVTVTGVDGRDDIELLYHFAFDQLGGVCTVRTLVAKPLAEVDSVTPIVEAANWIEREIHDLLGVNFIGHPNLRRLILADDWPEGLYPLREDAREKLPNRGSP